MNYIAKKIALQEKNILNHADLYLDYNRECETFSVNNVLEGLLW